MNRSIALIGGPDSGKTNYLARLWEALRDGRGLISAPTPPADIKYVEDALAHLLKGNFAPRSDTNLEEGRRDLVIRVRQATSPDVVEIVAPDVSGELWKRAVETLEISAEWLEQLNKSVAALVFIRILSDQNVTPLDWVTASRLLKLSTAEVTADEHYGEIPTQVSLCELLRFLELTLKPSADGARPRVAVLVTAWDRLDAERGKAGPTAYLKQEYPLFSGRLADSTKLDIRVFGASAVGGDLDADQQFRAQFLQGDLSKSGYIVVEDSSGVVKNPDLTLPLAWLISGG